MIARWPDAESLFCASGLLVTGHGAADALTGTEEGDWINSGGGDDTLERAMAGADVLIAGDGNDSLDGGAGRDLLFAGDGDDVSPGRGRR